MGTASDRGINLPGFLWDPLESHPHGHDGKALLRLAVLWNIPVARSLPTADFLTSSPLMTSYVVGNQSGMQARRNKSPVRKTNHRVLRSALTSGAKHQ
jgi:methylglyoxal synthase